jgi:hypothetical protein
MARNWVPPVDLEHSLGSALKRWLNLHAQSLIGYQGLSLGEQAATLTATPSFAQIYSKSDKKVYVLQSDGTEFVLGAPTPAVWGSITGTLALQTDLALALAGKEPTLTKGNLTATTPVNVSGGTGAVIGSGAAITISDASTSAKGAVQLSNSYTGTSQILAVTEKALTDGLATKQPSNVILSAIAALSNTPGQLTNDGAGNLSWVVDPSTGIVHNETTGLQGGDPLSTIPEYYHLTQEEHLAAQSHSYSTGQNILVAPELANAADDGNVHTPKLTIQGDRKSVV